MAVSRNLHSSERWMGSLSGQSVNAGGSGQAIPRVKHSRVTQPRGWKSENESCSVLSDSLRPCGLYSPWNSPGQNTRVGSFSLLGIFPTQGSNPGLPHCRWILYQLSQHGSPSFVGRGCNAILWDLPLGALPGSQSKYRRKRPCASGRGIEKGVILKYTRDLWSLQDLPSGKPNLLGILWF